MKYIFYSLISLLLLSGCATPGKIVTAKVQNDYKSKVKVEDIDEHVRKLIGFHKLDLYNCYTTLKKRPIEESKRRDMSIGKMFAVLNLIREGKTYYDEDNFSSYTHEWIDKDKFNEEVCYLYDCVGVYKVIYIGKIKGKSGSIKLDDESTIFWRFGDDGKLKSLYIVDGTGYGSKMNYYIDGHRAETSIESLIEEMYNESIAPYK